MLGTKPGSCKINKVHLAVEHLSSPREKCLAKGANVCGVLTSLTPSIGHMGVGGGLSRDYEYIKLGSLAFTVLAMGIYGVGDGVCFFEQAREAGRTMSIQGG